MVEKPGNKLLRQAATGGNPFRDKPMTRDAYMKLIYEDIAWLKKNAPHTLERDHIILVLHDSIKRHYPNS